MPLKKIKESLVRLFAKEEPEYIEIDLGGEAEKKKVKVTPFIIKKFEDVNEILTSLREGYTIAIVDISYLKKKDMIELKRTIAKLKKTADALEGQIAGFGESTIIITPSFAEIFKPKKSQVKKPEEL